MLIIRLIRLIMGYVSFTAKGGFPERFLNLCSRNGIPLWNLKSRKGIVYANTTISGYKAIRPAAKKSGMKLRIQNRHGLPFFMNKYRRRVGVLCGVAAFAIIITFMSTMIWSVEVIGNETIPDEVIIAAFEELGVTIGKRRGAIDVNSIELEALERMEDLSWLALNLNGSTAIIEVRERVGAPEIIDKETPCNIIAGFGGQIIKLEAYEGEPVEKLGAAVVKGDLIVSGVIENKDLSISLKHARALVIARTERELETSSQMNEQARKITEVKNKYTIVFFGIKIPVGFIKNPPEDAAYYKSQKRCEVSGVVLPISVIRESYTSYEQVTETRTVRANKLFAVEKYSHQLQNVLKKAKFIEGNESIEELQDKCMIKGKYICEESIGVEQIIEVEQSTE